MNLWRADFKRVQNRVFDFPSCCDTIGLTVLSVCASPDSKVVGASYQRSTGRPDLQALLNKHGLQKTGLFVCGPIQLVESLRDAVTFCEGLYDSDDNATRRPKRRFVIHSSTFEL